jgi:hypothetical protein
MYLFKEDIKRWKVYNIVIDIYGENKLDRGVGNRLLK